LRTLPVAIPLIGVKKYLGLDPMPANAAEFARRPDEDKPE
jgi:hypothetical protein